MNLYLILTAIAVFSFIYIGVRTNKARQLRYIEQYYFHKGIRHKLAQKHPHLTEQQLDLVFQGLKDYFRICHRAKRRMVSMPSQVIDDAWHEFILSTRIYKKFCAKALGRFLHHTPAEAMPRQDFAKNGIKRSWRIACELEGIDPKNPVRLPLIFAIDSLLNIKNGFIYQLDCSINPAAGYCASHIGCASGCIGSSCSSGDMTDSGSATDSSSCSGSCGGGCGGGD